MTEAKVSPGTARPVVVKELEPIFRPVKDMDFGDIVSAQPQLTYKEPFNVSTMTANFNAFLTRSTPVFWLQDRVEEIILWYSTPRTLLAAVVWLILCFRPYLALLTPQIAIIAVILQSYQGHAEPTSAPAPDATKDKEAAKSPTEAKNPSGKPSASETKQDDALDVGQITNAIMSMGALPSLPSSMSRGSINAKSSEIVRNMQYIQNMMGQVSAGVDNAKIYVPLLTWKDERTTLYILACTLLSTVPILCAAWLLPLQYILAFGGIGLLVLTHPYTVSFFKHILDFDAVNKNATVMKKALQQLVLDDALSDNEIRGHVFYIEKYEFERLGAGGQFSFEAFTNSMPPDSCHLIENESWIVDLSGTTDGWTYVYADGVTHTAPELNGKRAVSRRRRWVHRVAPDTTT